MIDTAKDLRNLIGKIEQHILALAAEGPTSSTIVCRYLKRGLWELKVRTRLGRHRVFAHYLLIMRKYLSSPLRMFLKNVR